jgi:hypothetical protein
MQGNNGNKVLTLKGALYAPEIASNLDRLGYKTCISDGVMSVKSPGGRDVMEATLEDGLYVVKGVGNIALHAYSLPNDAHYIH